MRRIALLIGWCIVAVIGLAGVGVLTGSEWIAAAEDSMAATKLAPRKIDLNSATIRELEKLPGIGPELAERVIQYRPYHKLDELIARKVMGRKQFARIKERVRVNSGSRRSTAQ